MERPGRFTLQTLMDGLIVGCVVVLAVAAIVLFTAFNAPPT